MSVKKTKLNELRVKSFVTVPDAEAEKVKAGIGIVDLTLCFQTCPVSCDIVVISEESCLLC